MRRAREAGDTSPLGQAETTGAGVLLAATGRAGETAPASEEYRDSVAPEALADCFDAAGLPVDTDTDADGSETAGTLVSPTDVAQAASAFACSSTCPSTPAAPKR